MKHFYEGIKGWFDYSDLYADMVSQANDGDLFVELGAWKGKSAAFMAVEIVNAGKQIGFEIIDNFQGLYQENKSPRANIELFRKEYRECLLNLNEVPWVRVIALPSTDAIGLYADESISFLFIDANHDYEHVKEDIKMWLPKIKAGGVIAGHDYTNFPGVKKAVDELLPEAEQVSVRCWKYRKP